MNTTIQLKFEHHPEPEFQLPIQNYHEFYRFYLTEHRNVMSRRLHVVGSSIGLYCVTKAIRHKKAKYVLYGLVAGYACAWVGHFVFEKNKPASFKQPLYSFISDWRMFADALRGNLSLQDRSKDKISG
ncbi:Mpo1-like protein [Acinetobacter sp. G11]|uniref:Mpo1-like protein n=1 Tax=Acinetobacter sp. G11 TaxID=3415989 RepID=UPI003C7AFA37